MNPGYLKLSSQQRGVVVGASVAMLAAGLMHLTIAPVHWAHAPGHGVFFVVVGAAEVLWGITFCRQQTAGRRRVGMVLAGGLVTLWAITRFLPVPFHPGAGAVELSDLVLKLSEGLSFVALAMLASAEARGADVRGSAWRSGVTLFTGAVAAGWLMYGLASAAEPVLPWLVARDPDDLYESTAESPNRGSRDTLALVTTGIASPFTNGGETPIAGALTATLTLSPGPARYSREIDLYLRNQQASPEAVEGATVRLTGRMRYMDHGTFRQVAAPAGGGHYRLPIELPMPGEWDLELQVETPAQRGDLHLNLDLYE